jgi:hypothetical protein
MIGISNKTERMEMCIMGRRGSGKTYYLTALLALGMKRNGTTKVNCGSEKIDTLRDLLPNFIKQNQPIPPTDINREFDYTFTVDIKDAKRIFSASKIEFSVKDLSGERLDNIFKSFVKPSEVSNSEREKLKDDTNKFLGECFKLNRWMFMMTEWQPDGDKELSEIFQHLCDRINANSERKTVKELRIAVVMAKCERGEIWGGRLDPEVDLFKARLPRTYKLLKDLGKKVKVKFFASSSFGVLGEDDPRPNRFYTDNDGTNAEYRSHLRDYDLWNPYGVIEPIYWLATGEKLHNEYL